MNPESVPALWSTVLSNADRAMLLKLGIAVETPREPVPVTHEADDVTED